MGIKDYDDLNDIQLDVLREIGNIGSGNAATSLANMLAQSVDISVPKIKILDYGQVAEELGGSEMMVVGLMLTMSEDVSGMLMFLLQKDFAYLTLNALLGESPDISNLDEMGESAIMEVANIMAASYVNAISTMTGLKINISVPSVCVDMVGAILSVPAIYFADISDKIIYIEDEFHSDEENVTSHILMIPDVQSLDKIMTNLGIEI